MTNTVRAAVNSDYCEKSRGVSLLSNGELIYLVLASCLNYRNRTGKRSGYIDGL